MVPPLEDEYTMLKKLVADLSLDKAMLQETLKPSRKHTLVDPLRTDWKVSIRRACSTLRIDRAKYVYKSKRDGIAPAETGGVRLFQGGRWIGYCGHRGGNNQTPVTLSGTCARGRTFSVTCRGNGCTGRNFHC